MALISKILKVILLIGLAIGFDNLLSIWHKGAASLPCQFALHSLYFDNKIIARYNEAIAQGMSTLERYKQEDTVAKYCPSRLDNLFKLKGSEEDEADVDKNIRFYTGITKLPIFLDLIHRVRLDISMRDFWSPGLKKAQDRLNQDCPSDYLALLRVVDGMGVSNGYLGRTVARAWGNYFGMQLTNDTENVDANAKPEPDPKYMPKSKEEMIRLYCDGVEE